MDDFSDLGENYPGKFVCDDCFDDPFIKEFIRNNAASRVCSYTGKKSRVKDIAAPVDLVIQLIYDGISRHYGEAWASGSSWDKEDERYINETWDTDDLLQEYVELAGDASGELYDDILGAFPYQDWSRDDPWGATEAEILQWGWNRFVDTVRYQRRFFFTRGDKERERDREEIGLGALLEIFGKRCASNGLLKTIPAGTQMIRCRARSKRSQRFSGAREMGPPPKELAAQNRMSPAGIPMFYGADDKATAIAETPDLASRYALAKFRTLRPMTLLDLSEVKPVSIFDDHDYADYEWSLFMRGFLADFTKPVENRDRIHIDYIPTQVVTEYLRDAILEGNIPIDGIKYRSARRKGGFCYVLFTDRYGVEPELGELSNEDTEKERWHAPKNGYTLKLISIRHHG
ncbi:HEPN-associated N-terminal domain-containing protein [Acidocella facilis]|uniref:HEPN-associated N-terminal domain-containing protein n=1 Tax=Acidocella facilis TaxID=525 RepID=UPI001F15899A|nr:HEPN-associated N-terminal domain-containing protein [Acidocella facilis]